LKRFEPELGLMLSAYWAWENVVIFL